MRKYFIVDVARRQTSRLEHSLEVLGQKQNREVVPLELTFGKLQEPSAEWVLTCIVRDITQRKIGRAAAALPGVPRQAHQLGNRGLFYVTLGQPCRT